MKKICLWCKEPFVGEKKKRYCSSSCWYETLLPTQPTREEIQQRCLEIQAAWTESEELERRGGQSPYAVPFIKLSDVGD